MTSNRESTGDAAELDIPAGFSRLHLPGPFVDINGPLLARYTDGKFRIGVRLEERHCNAAGICHGGMHATFADLQIAIGIVVQADVQAFLPTINLSLDYVAPGRIGDWLEGETEVIRTTRNLAFGSCMSAWTAPLSFGPAPSARSPASKTPASHSKTSCPTLNTKLR